MSEYADNQGTAQASKLQTVVPHPYLERFRLAGTPLDAGGYWHTDLSLGPVRAAGHSSPLAMAAVSL